MAISAIDINVLLCLACSSSLPSRSHDSVFMTNCCQKPICSLCISTNPRLARYNPCLACLGGVQAVGSRSNVGRQEQLVPPERVNIDGAVRDEDTFVLGDDEHDDTDSDEEGAPPPPYLGQYSAQSSSSAVQPTDRQHTNSQFNLPVDIKMDTNAPNHSSEYHIQRGDTVLGIALRFGVNGRELCRLNKLPPSTLSTTPHLLHTRTVLTLPASAHLKDKNGQDLVPPNSSDVDTERQRLRAVRRTRERAAKRLQTVTKEVDWRVAKAYIAIAEQEDVDGFRTQYDLKQKEVNVGPNFRNAAGGQASNLELLALDKYFEDDEWEATERREGRSSDSSRIPPFQKF
ncbi:hypothetical protein F5050DRAFT_1571999 [Lentinula boryana]|uniref:LysM domain-containing protein n=1 Tax=Lentinula boryana TaxID=40481 RepID=A0ABQ8QCE9_9AGAR|nr:hypothetical protein F5050DRAFT_1571999 [Lentinula boryana]